ncbi:hypothetical protein [Streptomyces sp. MNU103]|uniref:hypothetical protein n=1 Tax=Streptomyces sp. MNU103 TaxID=2560024 RepID=UPI001E356F88|nr:hypothetical protein [Streptomyces sp. MNU103]
MTDTTATAGPVYHEGDRVLCADGVARTVRAMAPHVNGEPARVVVEDGTEWIAANCRAANPADLAAARMASASTAARVREADPDDPQWRAALADLTAVHAYLKAAETSPAVLEGLARGEAEAARELAELERRHQQRDDQEETVRAEVAARFTIIARDGQAHGFQPLAVRGEERPVAFTYRTGYGHAVRYGWVLAGGGLFTEHPEAVYRQQAEEDAAATVMTLAARGELDTTVVDALASMSLDELREALDRLRDRGGRTRGARPEHVTDETVRAALEALAASHFAEVPRGFNPAAAPGDDDHDPAVTGLVVEPRHNGHVTAYWVERGRYLTGRGEPFTTQLGAIRRTLEDAGWSIVPGGRRVVTAYRPTV